MGDYLGCRKERTGKKSLFALRQMVSTLLILALLLDTADHWGVWFSCLVRWCSCARTTAD